MAGGQVLQIAEKPLGRSRCELQLEGELDLWSIERLRAALARMARDNEALLVGLEHCTFVDSTGIALFLQARRQLEEEGGRLAIYGCSDQVARIFEVAGLTDAGIVFSGCAEAIAALVGAE
jgi:anti-anti-sigma factor